MSRAIKRPKINRGKLDRRYLIETQTQTGSGRLRIAGSTKSKREADKRFTVELNNPDRGVKNVTLVKSIRFGAVHK